MLASLAHLGTKKNAWRVFTNLRHSSISKEVFYTGLFGISILFGVVQILFLKQDLFLITAFASIAGLALVYNMAQVYRLRAAPGWNTWRTNAGFLVSALLLGLAAMTPILYYESISTGIQIRPGGQITVCVIILALLIMQLLLMRKRPGQSPAYELRMGLLLLGMGIAAASLFGHVDFTRTSLLIFAVVILEETLGRWLFYRSRL
jgi:DMSO reductase anchor subunit